MYEFYDCLQKAIDLQEDAYRFVESVENKPNGCLQHAKRGLAFVITPLEALFGTVAHLVTIVDSFAYFFFGLIALPINKKYPRKYSSLEQFTLTTTFGALGYAILKILSLVTIPFKALVSFFGLLINPNWLIDRRAHCPGIYWV